jgi:CubicO group peptidase (beta-lactamase class C family)
MDTLPLRALLLLAVVAGGCADPRAGSAPTPQMGSSLIVSPTPTAGTPPLAVLVSPVGLIAGASPTLTWNVAPGADRYSVFVGGASAGLPYLTTFSAAQVCTGLICSIQPQLALASPGVYEWWVLTHNVNGDGPWSAGMIFEVDTALPVGPPTSIPPTADTLGLFYGVGNYYALLPADIESAADLRFQMGFSRSGFVAPLPFKGDFDGTGGDTVGFYDVRTHEFSLSFDNSPNLDAGAVIAFGADAGFGAIPLAGHWSGPGPDTIGLFDPQHATFLLRSSNSPGPADIAFSFGTSTSLPVTGDWAHSGTDTVGVYEPATGMFELRNSNSSGLPDLSFQFGPVDAANMLPVVGDWDGDGTDTVGVYDQAHFILYLRNSNSAGAPDHVIQLQATSWAWRPMAGRWRPTSAPPESPGFDWPPAPTPESVNVDRAALDAAFAIAQSLPYSRSLLVIRHGELVREGYFNGTRPEIAHQIASASKSVESALFGIAQSQGAFGPPDAGLPQMLTTPISQLLPPQYYPNNADPQRSILLANLMTMTSGWQAETEMTVADWSSFFFGSDDWLATAMARTPARPPDPNTPFAYSTVNNFVGTHILSAKVGNLADFAAQNLCAPLGIRILWWNHEAQPDFMVSGGEMGMKPRDMARFGYLYLHQGNVDGRQLVSSDWVQASTAGWVPTDSSSASQFGQLYGLWWWHPKPAGEPGSDVFAALGHGGQFIFVIPSKDAIIVTTNRYDVGGDPENEQYTAINALLLGYLLPALQ